MRKHWTLCGASGLAVILLAACAGGETGAGGTGGSIGGAGGSLGGADGSIGGAGGSIGGAGGSVGGAGGAIGGAGGAAGGSSGSAGAPLGGSGGHAGQGGTGAFGGSSGGGGHGGVPTLDDTATLVTGCDFTDGVEGPAVDADGNLYVANYTGGNTSGHGMLGRLDTTNTGASFEDFVHMGGQGNGARVHNGYLYVVVKSTMTLLRIDLADPSEQRALQWVGGAGFADFSVSNGTWQINDLDIGPNGDIYVSAPCWGGCAGNEGRIYHLTVQDIEEHHPDTGGDGVAIDYIENIPLPNGLAVHPSGSHLYVAIGGGAQAHDLRLVRFPLQAGGGLGALEPILTIASGFAPWAQDLDGVRFDATGDLYVAHYGTAQVHKISTSTASPAIVHSIALPYSRVSNLAFGGADRRTLFITVQDGAGCGYVASARVDQPGRAYAP